MSAAVHPGATEIWYDGIDQDCAGDNDFDQDRDGIVDDDDCDDTNPLILGHADRCDGLDGNCDGVWTVRVPAVCPTIQSALDASRGLLGEVTVAPGIYTENLNFRGVRVALVGEAGPASTIIDGGGTAPVVTFDRGEGPDSVLDGFTLQNGYHLEGGGGIRVDRSSPTLTNLVVTGNRVGTPGTDFGKGAGVWMVGSLAEVSHSLIHANAAASEGGGVYAAGGSAPFIHHVRVIENTAKYGGGIALAGSHPDRSAQVRNAVIAGNTATVSGGGLYLSGATRPTSLANVTVTGNTGYQAPGVFVDASVSAFTNVDIAFNRSSTTFKSQWSERLF
jgi:hypothetical protein